MIAELQVSNPDNFPDLPILHEALKRPKIEVARRTVTSQLKRHGAELDLDYWVHRLRFPMLRRSEIRVLLDSPGEEAKALAKQFLADRLGRAPKTLDNILSRS